MIPDYGPCNVNCIAIRPGGTAVAVSTRDYVRLFETEHDEPKEGFFPPEVQISADLRFSADGTRLVALEYGGKWLQIDTATGKVMASLDPPSLEICGARLSPDGKKGAGVMDYYGSVILLWEIPSVYLPR